MASPSTLCSNSSDQEFSLSPSLSKYLRQLPPISSSKMASPSTLCSNSSDQEFSLSPSLSKLQVHFESLFSSELSKKEGTALLPTEFRKSMTPGGVVYRQTTLTGGTIQATQSLHESNSPTLAVNTDDSARIKKGRGKTREKGLEKMKKVMGSKMKIEIPIGKGRPTKPIQSAKLSNELEIISRNFLPLPNKWKELTREDKDAALIRCHERFNINLDEHYVKDSCKDILKNRSRQWRYKLKQKFESARSLEEARKMEVEQLTSDNWNKLCDMWSDPEHKKRCEINKANRTKLKSNHFMGSKAFVAYRAKIGEKESEV